MYRIAAQVPAVNALTLEDLGIVGEGLGERKAGMLPYLALALGLAVVLWANWFFVLPG